MSLKNKVIHHEKFMKASSLLLLLHLVALFILVYFSVMSIWVVILFTTILFALIVVPSNRIWAFSVYNNSIELLNTFTNSSKEVIKLDQIRQVRYESGFFDWQFLNFYSNIIIYPQDDVSLKSVKQDRLVLKITGFNRKARILKLLQFFQSKDLDVVIKTDSRKIKEGTGLRNWDQAFK